MSQRGIHLQFIGPHKIELDGPDVLHVRCIGEMNATHVRQITALAEAHIAQLAGSYMLVDLRQGAGLPKEARLLVAGWLRDNHLAAVVNYGASTMSRAFSSLAIRALALLYGKDVENIFVETEEDAHTWVARHRTRRSPR